MKNVYSEVEELANKWTLKNIDLPVEFQKYDSPRIFKLLNSSLMKRHTRKQLILPNFADTETVVICSDYGGEAKGSKYYTYSFVFAAYSGLGFFSDRMIDIRKKYGLDNPQKEISFKDAHYGQMFRCIDEYLTVANNMINGLVFTLAVEKDIVSLLDKDDKKTLKHTTEQLLGYSYGKWKPSIFEKNMRIIYTLTYFIKLLIPTGKKIFWMTDEDAIMANESKIDDTTRIISNIINLFKDAPKYQLMGFTPKPYYEDELYFLTDILSIADLSAGSIEQLLTRQATGNGELSPLAEQVIKWSSVQGVGLDKLIFIINKQNGVFSGNFLGIECPEYPKNGTYVDYVYDVSVNKKV